MGYLEADDEFGNMFEAGVVGDHWGGGSEADGTVLGQEAWLKYWLMMATRRIFGEVDQFVRLCSGCSRGHRISEM